MNQTKHTPPPYRQSGVFILRKNIGEKPIGEMALPSDAEFFVRIGNSHHELLEACKLSLIMCDELYNQNNILPSEFDTVVEALTLVIQKTRGES